MAMQIPAECAPTSVCALVHLSPGGVAEIALTAFALGVWLGIAWNHNRIARNELELVKLRAAVEAMPSRKGS